MARAGGPLENYLHPPCLSWALSILWHNARFMSSSENRCYEGMDGAPEPRLTTARKSSIKTSSAIGRFHDATQWQTFAACT
eukprot:4093823-Amphidinium_carterae.1